MHELNRDLFASDDPFTVALDCFSVFVDNKGIVVIMSPEEVITIKLRVTDDPNQPLRHGDVARIKGIDGENLLLVSNLVSSLTQVIFK